MRQRIDLVIISTNLAGAVTVTRETEIGISEEAAKAAEALGGRKAGYNLDCRVEIRE